jgi:hypothetical protein
LCCDGIRKESVMSEFVRGVGVGASPGLTRAGHRRRPRVLPFWLRLLVVLAAALGLWALIIYAVSWFAA